MEFNYNSTELARLEGLFNTEFNPTKTFDFKGVNIGNLKAWLKAKEVNKAKKTGIMITVTETNFKTMRDESRTAELTAEQLETFIVAAEYFNGSYESSKAFVVHLVEAAQANLEAKGQYLAHTLNTVSQASDTFNANKDNSTKTVEVIPVPLNTAASAVNLGVGTVDEMFTLKHLVKDTESQLYWRFNNGEIMPIPVKEKDDRCVIGPDPEFWERFFDENSELLQKYLIAIHTYTDAYKHGNAGDFFEGMDAGVLRANPQYEAGLYAIAPSFVIASIKVYIRIKKDIINKTSVYDGIDIRLASGVNGNPSKTRADWQEVLKSTLIKSVPTSKLKTVVVFSNDSTCAIHRLKSIPVLKTRPFKVHPELLEFNCSAWDNFLHSVSADGNCKFPSQRMGELRLAKAIYGMVSSKDYSRQMLCVFGEGGDGKSVCFDAIAKALGEGRGGIAKTGLAQNIFESNFGLMDCINKRLLVVDDILKPFEFMESDKVKRISGAGDGRIQVDRKYAAPYSWKPSGCKIVMSTNSPVVLRSEATITRCLPLVFMRNYKRTDQKDPAILTAELSKEVFNDGNYNSLFFWAIEVLRMYSTIRNVNGELCPLLQGVKDEIKANPNCECINGRYPFDSKNLLICTDEMFDKWYNGQLDLNPDDEAEFRSLRQRAFEEETTIPHRANSFVHISQDDATDADETTGVYNKIVKILFRRDPAGVVICSDIGEAIMTILQRQDFKCSVVYSYLAMLGFAEIHDIKKLINSPQYRALKQSIMDTFKIDKSKPVKILNKSMKAFTGIKMFSLDDIQTYRETTQC